MDDNQCTYSKDARKKKSSSGQNCKNLETNSWSNATKSFQSGIVAGLPSLKEKGGDNRNIKYRFLIIITSVILSPFNSPSIVISTPSILLRGELDWANRLSTIDNFFHGSQGHRLNAISIDFAVMYLLDPCPFQPQSNQSQYRS